MVGTLADDAGWAVGFGLLAGVLAFAAAALVLTTLLGRERRPLGSAAFGLFVASQNRGGDGGPPHGDDDADRCGPE